MTTGALAEPLAAPRSMTILGSTGSIGRNTLDLVARNPEAFRVEVLTANRSVETLAEQARQFRPRRAVIADEAGYGPLKDALAPLCPQTSRL